MVTEPVPYRWTVEEYHRLGEADVLPPGKRVELLDGEIVEMAAIGSPHQAVVDRLTRFFVTALGDRAIVRVQGPVTIDAYSEPEPDLALLVNRPDFYAGGHPGPDDTLLVVEVSHTTGRFDRLRKVPLYAADGIVEVWLVDIPGDIVEVYRQPGPVGYAGHRVARRGDALSPAAFPDLTLPVDAVLG